MHHIRIETNSGEVIVPENKFHLVASRAEYAVICNSLHYYISEAEYLRVSKIILPVLTTKTEVYYGEPGSIHPR